VNATVGPGKTSNSERVAMPLRFSAPSLHDAHDEVLDSDHYGENQNETWQVPNEEV
jgi:hypothetical protein